MRLPASLLSFIIPAMFNLQPGDIIPVHACKADGATYRRWQAVIESMAEGLIVTVGEAGSPAFNTNGGVFHIEHHLRAYYWFDKFYNLIEAFAPDGGLLEIYINIASPPELANGILKFKDHELDISKVLPNPARLIDEDEFAEAILKYGYSPEFQENLYAVAREALALADGWTARPCPVFRLAK